MVHSSFMHAQLHCTAHTASVTISKVLAHITQSVSVGLFLKIFFFDCSCSYTTIICAWWQTTEERNVTSNFNCLCFSLFITLSIIPATTIAASFYFLICMNSSSKKTSIQIHRPIMTSVVITCVVSAFSQTVHSLQCGTPLCSPLNKVSIFVDNLW